MTHVPAGAHLLSTMLGIVMAAAVGFHSGTASFVVAILCGLAVAGGIRWPIAATAAVLLGATAIMLADAPPVQTGLVGLCGAYYLMLRHTEGRLPRPAGRPAVVAAVCFTVVAVSVASLPLDVPWLPMLAAPLLFVAYVVALRPFFSSAVERRTST